MSQELRDQLVQHIVETEPELRNFIRAQPHSMMTGSWDLLSYSFQRGFEVMWDSTRADMSGLLLRPLLVLWRQSVELSIKAAIIETAGEIRRDPGHDLTKLFAQLIEVRAELGCCDDDDYTCKVTDMIALVQSFDPFADRFRYPTARGGKPFEGIDTDFDELFQAHWIIVTWCEGATIEIVESRPPAGTTVEAK